MSVTAWMFILGYKRRLVTRTAVSDLAGLGCPLQLPRPVVCNVAAVAAEGTFTAAIASPRLAEQVREACGAYAENFPFWTRIYEFRPRGGDEILVRTFGDGLPLVIRRQGEVIVNFDLAATQNAEFPESKRPIYTYIPGFHVHMVPEGIRRPVSNLVQALRGPKYREIAGHYQRLSLTGFEFSLLLLNTILTHGDPFKRQLMSWPGGKRAVFVALHDVDSEGFFRRRDNDPLFRIEAKHRIRSTWFLPTALLEQDPDIVDFLLDAGHEAGWHGHHHDHRDHIKPFADQAVEALRTSYLVSNGSLAVGMRLPRLLKSSYLFALLERKCPKPCYDTTFLRGIFPYYLWLNGRQSQILEIPCTIPADIRVHNELSGMSRGEKSAAVLQAQIEQTEKLIEAGAVVSIVTHPEKSLSERPDFLEVYDQYLAYIRSRSDLWITTAGELFQFWTASRAQAKSRKTDAINDAIKIERLSL